MTLGLVNGGDKVTTHKFNLRMIPTMASSTPMSFLINFSSSLEQKKLSHIQHRGEYH